MLNGLNMGGTDWSESDLTTERFARAYWSGDDSADVATRDSIRTGGVAAVNLIESLARHAPNDAALGNLGAGPLEDLVNWHGRHLAAELDAALDSEPRLRLAVPMVRVGPEQLESDVSFVKFFMLGFAFSSSGTNRNRLNVSGQSPASGLLLRGQNRCRTSTDRPAVRTTSLTARVSGSGCSRSVSKISLQVPPYCLGSVHLTSREWALNTRRNESSERGWPRSSWPGIPLPFKKTPSERSCPATQSLSVITFPLGLNQPISTVPRIGRPWNQRRRRNTGCSRRSPISQRITSSSSPST